MAALILGVSKADCASFARKHDVKQWGWISPRSSERMRGRRFSVVYATDSLRADREAFRRMVDLSEVHRDRVLG